MKAAILVNGVPASGKSTVAKAVARQMTLPLMALDTVKEPLFTHFGMGDRDHNRALGRAAYEIIFTSLADWPDPTLVVIDAWFGFQPIDVLERHLSTAGLSRVVELWCHAPAAVVAERYVARASTRSAGHPGPDYVPELLALHARATPTGRAPVLSIETTQELPTDQIVSWIRKALHNP